MEVTGEKVGKVDGSQLMEDFHYKEKYLNFHNILHICNFT